MEGWGGEGGAFTHYDKQNREALPCLAVWSCCLIVKLCNMQASWQAEEKEGWNRRVGIGGRQRCGNKTLNNTSASSIDQGCIHLAVCTSHVILMCFLPIHPAAA